MATVCFTGAGKRFGSETFTRVQWIALAMQSGHTPHDHVYWNTDYLVASRDNTSKASAARENGRTRVITYAQWEEMLRTGQSATQFQPSRPISPGAAQPRYIPPKGPSPSERRAAAQALAGLDDTPPYSDRGERVRKINI